MEEKSEGLNPILRLIMEKGPLEGHTLEFVPGSKIRIGRIVRGNTISIKDAGVSTKHLGIDFEAESGRVGSWRLSDVGSSNGTLLNSDQLEPFVQVKLSDGDVIKIGEYTSIRVGIGVKIEMEEAKVRRNPPRRRVGKLELGKNENNENPRGEMRRLKGGVKNTDASATKDLKEEGNEKMENLGRKENLKKTNSKNSEGFLDEKFGAENEVEDIGDVGQDEGVVKLRPKRGRSAKIEEIAVVYMDLDQDGVEGIEGKQGKVQTSKRITRGMRKRWNLAILEENGLQSGKDIESSRRITRSLRKGGNLERLEESELKCGDEAGNKIVRKATRTKRNSAAETFTISLEDETRTSRKIAEKLASELKEIKEVNQELQVMELLEEEVGRSIDRMVEEKQANSGINACDALVSTSGVKHGSPYELDLEKLTIGEWLDYLVVNLPKQILDDTEEMILGMRKKAEKFHEFMVLQNNSKSRVVVPVQ